MNANVAKAPDFSLTDQHDNTHALSHYQGQWVVLYFYPKDDTPGCTKEACQFRDDLSAFENLNTKVLGVSVDPAESHEAFANKYHLNFPLLADNDGKVSKAYGVFKNLGVMKFSKRHTFLINPEGNIEKHYRKVKPATHSQDVLDDLAGLQKAT